MQNAMNNPHEVTADQREELLKTLEARFHRNMSRHEGVLWNDVKARLDAGEEKLWSIREMEATGGEPDVVGQKNESGEVAFFDCSKESPEGRRNVCYDRKAQESRKKFQTWNNAVDMAASMGIKMLTVEQYKEFQKFGEFDTKTSSWVKTPDNIRSLGGALFCDYRYDTVFVYHNGAESYYGVRGFRGMIRI